METTKIKTVLHKAGSRGHANHGWLKTFHSFSFASYYNPERMNFGVLRVINDDYIAPGTGFSTHPHDNMEIITIPFSGALAHKDSMDNSSEIRAGEIQVMSAGSGILHSEFNASKQEEVTLFQIWLFPNKKNVEPRYQQISLKELEKENELYQILSPNPDDAGVWIHQNAWFNMGNFTKSWEGEYTLNDQTNGVYFMVIEGAFTIEGQPLSRRDGLGVWPTGSIKIETDNGGQILIMEIPMEI